MIRGDAKRHAVRKLVRPKRVGAELPKGPSNQPPSYDVAAALAHEGGLDQAICEWYTQARKEWSDLAGEDLPSNSRVSGGRRP